MDRYSDRDDYGTDFDRGRYGRGDYRRRDDTGGYGRPYEADEAEGYGRAAMGGRDYSTSGRYFDDNELDRFERYGTSRYPDRERDYNMGGYGGGRHTDAFYMRGEYTGRGPEGGSYGYGPSDDYERTGYGRRDRDFDRASPNRGYSDRDFDSDRHAWSPGRQPRYEQGGPRGRRDSPYSGAEPTGHEAGGYGYGYGNVETGPHTGRGPKGYERSTERMKEDVCDRLWHHGRIDASDIEVKVENGEVTLTGTVDSRETKRMVEDVVESVPGVRDVHNQLRISRTAADRGSEQRTGEQENGQTNSRGPSRKTPQT